MNMTRIHKPTLLLDEKKARQNISKMADKARQADVVFRPHFKTHQSAGIGNWFREYGVSKITVSSVDMAVYFAEHGWDDITIAFPVNVRQLSTISQLAKKVTLNLLVESEIVVQHLHKHLAEDVNVWLEIDTGYHRTGLPWNDLEAITAVSTLVHASPHLHLAGLLLHAGNTYKARGKTAVLDTHHHTLECLHHVQAHLQQQGIHTKISIGDTPACSLADDFAGIDEIRPGNFIFYDIMQAQIGACTAEKIAVAVACPIVAKYPERNCIAIYGGAVHLSKEALMRDDGVVSYGRIALPTPDGWYHLPDENFIYSLSQEHGLIKASNSLLKQVEVGDLLLVLPVHSCLTANLLKSYVTLEGKRIKMADFDNPIEWGTI